MWIVAARAGYVGLRLLEHHPCGIVIRAVGTIAWVVASSTMCAHAVLAKPFMHILAVSASLDESS